MEPITHLSLTASDTSRDTAPSAARPALAALLGRQAGVIGRAQARAVGLSTDAIDRRLAGRHWVPLHPRVYLDRAHRLTDEARVRAAVLWAGDDAVLSGLAAAWWHGVAPALAGEVAVTVPRRRSPRNRPGVIVRRRDLADDDRTSRHGVPVTALPLAVLESAVELGAAGGPFLDRALQSHVGFAEVARAHTRNPGAAGATAARAALAATAERAGPAAVRLLVSRLREARLIGWRTEHPAAGVVLPVAFPQARVAVEAEGWARPLGAEARRRTLWRRGVLARAGWTVLTCRWHDLATRPEAVLGEIGLAVALGRRAGRPASPARSAG
ncbi:endonuclease domain-containing protein [Pseudonocardia sp. RS11V-5]|uniref:endonuclease domain-containing protein n=1 Tax=Pseudonocardia terrae TaxID=2905831 RepID=UPI001E4A2B83|nr:endonuclease domain-containing protein [Pseudonocardia terrae]MCE3554177.1 endonuclease domain-containing protein [Pseudonocardia terrae]